MKKHLKLLLNGLMDNRFSLKFRRSRLFAEEFLVFGIIFLFLSYKYIDTAWIKWPFMIMLGGAFYYSTKEDLFELDSLACPSGG